MSGYQSVFSSDRFPPLRAPRVPEKAVYSAAPVQGSVRQAPPYEAIYGTEHKPTLKAYDIDLSIHIDSNLSPRLGKITCTFDEADAYRPKSQNKELPLIVKPLRQFSTLERRSKSNESPTPSGHGVSRRRTLGAADDPRTQKAWFSSSCDGPATSSLPRNFVRKPTVLHAAAPVEIEHIPYIDEESFPPAKPVRSYTELDTFASLPEKESNLHSYRPIRSSLSSARKERPQQKEFRAQLKTEQQYSEPSCLDIRNRREQEHRHAREDSGYRSDRKPSIDYSDSIRASPYVAKLESDTEDEDFDWGDEYLNSRRCSLVLRTQTSLRVKTIIDKLLNASGRDQRRALFSLKQIFQDDKDLVHEFVQNGGLDCMIQLGRVADQNHQNYILRALGQVMLYVDGMNGIIAHNATIQWLYELLDSPFRLVVKTALKLLLVFIEYNDNNSLLVLTAISVVDRNKGQPDWTGLIKVVSEKDSPDPETLVYGLTVINKALHGIPDRDTFYDSVDTLDQLGMEEVMKGLQKTGNKEVLEQCRLYERELNQEDERGDSEEDTNTKMRNDVSYSVDHQRRKSSRSSVAKECSTPEDAPAPSSRRGSEMTSDLPQRPSATPAVRAPVPSNGWSYTDGLVLPTRPLREVNPYRKEDDRCSVPENQPDFRELENVLRDSNRLGFAGSEQVQDEETTSQQSLRGGDADRRSTMRRRHQEARQRQEEHMTFTQNKGVFNKTDEATVEPKSHVPWRNEVIEKVPQKAETQQRSIMDEAVVPVAKKVPEPLRLEENEENERPEEEEKHVKAPPPLFPSLFSPTESKTMDFPEPEPKPAEPEKPAAPKAKIVADDGGGGFAAMLQRRAAKASESNRESFQPRDSEAEAQWKKAAENLKSRPLIINDLDFSEFHGAEFEQDPLVMARMAQLAQDKGLMGGGGGPGGPPPPPPPGSIPLPPRLQGKGFVPPAPPLPAGGVPPPPPPNVNMRRDASPGPQTKGVMKLHWKATASEPPPVPSLKQKGTFWHKLDLPVFDPNKLVQLFESKQQKEVAVKKVNEAKPQLLQVLSMKRSQAINIGLTKLPPVTVIPAAIMKFDSLVLNKEGIEKILKTMMPTSKEVEEIENKMAEHPDMQLGNAEQFVLKLSQIPCLLERLKLWLFTLEYKNIEKDISEPLMDLQLAMKEMEESKTFKTAMGMLLAIGNSLSGTEIKGFYLDYLTKASEVKDPVYKHPLTYHLAEYMIEHFPEGTDLYSELGAVARSARVDYKELFDNLKRLEKECKASWEYLAKISKNDNSSMKQKINDYLIDVAERIHQLNDIYRIAKNRWHGFLLYFGYSVQEIPDQNPNDVFKMVTEFSLEYRTTRDKILQQRKRMAEKRERNKTRGKMWALEGGSGEGESSQRRRIAPVKVAAEDRHDELSRVLTGLAEGDGTLRRRARPTPDRTAARTTENGDGDSPDDEILNSLAKAATLPTEARDHRRKARQFNRKSLRRTRTLKLVDGQLETEY